MGGGASEQRSGGPIVGSVALWFGLFGAPAFWSVQLIATYAIAADTCFHLRQALASPASPASSTVLEIIIAVALAGAAAALLTSMASWRALRAEAERTAHGPVNAAQGRARFMAHAGIMLSVLFTAAVALSAVAVLLIPAC